MLAATMAGYKTPNILTLLLQIVTSMSHEQAPTFQQRGGTSDLEGAVQPGGCVPSKDAHEGKQQDCSCEQPPSVGWGQEAQHSKHHGDKSHGQQLQACSSIGRQEGRILGRPEDISMYLCHTSLLSWKVCER